VDPQRSRIASVVPTTVFISHSSADDAYIKGCSDGNRVPEPDSVWWIVGRYFYDPFYHSITTGGADAYVKVVGLALLSARRVLIVWSRNALRSDFVRAEILLATERKKKIAVYVMPDAPEFPIPGVELVRDVTALRDLMKRWKVQASSGQ
jgi:hypothetical protein